MNTNANIKELQETMERLFKAGQSGLVPESLRVEHCRFQSNLSIKIVQNGLYDGDLYYHELVDQQHEGNRMFSYPVVLPVERKQYKEGIVLLHGLNEKSWDKYYSWAAALALRTQRPVILFPLANHMNRAPKSWSDPRLMKDVVSSRKKIGSEADASFANAALSTRLGAHPELFVYSGMQSYYDVCALFDQINRGEHPFFEANAQIDFFAYSIGAFLAQILSIANPGGRFSTSRLFIFAGGPTFDRMQGSSRYIMDLQAFRSLLTLKRRRILNKIHREISEAALPGFAEMWEGFVAMLGQRKGRKIRRAWLDCRGEMIQVLALKGDRVMPSKAIVSTLKSKAVRIDVVDLPYTASHENPFPINEEKILPMVNRAFTLLMSKAEKFYLANTVKVFTLQNETSLMQVPLAAM